MEYWKFLQQYFFFFFQKITKFQHLLKWEKCLYRPVFVLWILKKIFYPWQSADTSRNTWSITEIWDKTKFSSIQDGVAFGQKKVVWVHFGPIQKVTDKKCASEEFIRAMFKVLDSAPLFGSTDTLTWTSTYCENFCLSTASSEYV